MSDEGGPWARVDELLLGGHRLQAMKQAMEQFDWSLGRAIDEVSLRWSVLVQECPDRFEVPIDDYWNGFYS